MKKKIPDSAESWKYVIFTPENYYYQLYNYNDNRHNLASGVFSVIENQIDFGGSRLYIFSVNNDTLTLSSPPDNFIFVKNNNAPGADEWIIPVNVLEEVHLSGLDGLRDITYDGSSFWTTDEFGITKIDTVGNILNSYKLYNTGGIVYGNGKLWVSSYDTLKEINPLNGEIISMNEISSANIFLSSLSYEPGYIWASSNYSTICKIEEHSREIVQSFEFFEPLSVEFQAGKLWISSSIHIYSVDPGMGKAINTYDLQGYSFGIIALTFDGNNYWAGYFDYERNSSSLLKLDIPY